MGFQMLKMMLFQILILIQLRKMMQFLIEFQIQCQKKFLKK